jgi:hypothetical protein
LHHESNDTDRERCDDKWDDPVADTRLGASEGGRGLSSRQTLLQVEGEEPREHVERAVRHVDHAHQPEDEGEAAGDDEIEARQCEPVETDDDEDPQILRGLVGHPRGHEGENCCHERTHGQRPGRNRQQAPAECEVAIGGRR